MRSIVSCDNPAYLKFVCARKRPSLEYKTDMPTHRCLNLSCLSLGCLNLWQQQNSHDNPEMGCA